MAWKRGAHRSHVSGRRWIKSKISQRWIEKNANRLLKKGGISMKKFSIFLLLVLGLWGCAHFDPAGPNDVYTFLLKGGCPAGQRPLLVNGTAQCRSQDDAELNQDIGETGINYPESRKYYPISREKYPEFYTKLDINKDGKVTLNELGEWQPIFNLVTKKCQEGDIDSVVKEFMRH